MRLQVCCRCFGASRIYGVYGELQDLFQVPQAEKAAEQCTRKSKDICRHTTRYHSSESVETGTGVTGEQMLSYKDGKARIILWVTLLRRLWRKATFLHNEQLYAQARTLCLLELQEQYGQLFRPLYPRGNTKAVCAAKDIRCNGYVL